MSRKTNRVGVQVEDTRICVVMVGLPARGKSYIAQKGEFSALLRGRSIARRACQASVPYTMMERAVLTSGIFCRTLQPKGI